MAVPAGYPIESVDNAVRILLMLRHEPALRITAVARDLDVARSTAHRMLTTLQARDMLRQDPATKAYGAGPALVELGVAVMGASDLKAAARPVLEQLAERTGETVHLTTLEGTELAFIDGVEGKQVIRAGLRAGQHSPAHTTGAGKALLAALDPAEFRRRYPASKLTGGTAEAFRSRRALENELDDIRQRGFGTNHAESEDGLTAVGAVVRDSRGTVRGALALSGPSFRLPSGKLEALVTELRWGVQELGNRIG
ncbi:IclR family transcriptional regulator [Nocardia sp. NBC_01327]|uniref:IclR family transcriptional regulator n=1 Tax=Nocardia sp. NBC_01327 TaxID=2903593 RepID=UPI002E10E9BA|nr:IclR family transcriptional regulator [Nocardia sp. NBC_01327]